MGKESSGAGDRVIPGERKSGRCQPPGKTVEISDGERRMRFAGGTKILLDAQMPGMDGFETAEHIKRRERTRHVPILFLTAVDYDPHLAFRGYQAGAVDYISKPFDPWVLRSKVSVFVDLWAVQSQLAARATENDTLGAAVDDVLELLGTTGTPVPEATLDLVRKRLGAARAGLD